MTQRNRKQCNSVAFLTAPQAEAVGTFQRDLRSAMPHIAEMTKTAQQLHNAMVSAPVWKLIDNQKPNEPLPDKPEEWTVGHAQVNYVDHIEIEGTQGK